MSKTIVITGAGVGLGRALARRFATEGENVVLLARTAATVEAVAAEIGERAFAVPCDVSSPDQVRAAFAKIADKHGRIDALINNAAVFKPFLIAEATDDQIILAINTNFLGPVLCTRSAIPLLNKGGHIINVSSESVEVPFPHLSMYVSSKAALERFSAAMSRELEPNGIRVTVVRAGQMMDPDKVWDVDMVAYGKFVQAAIAAGVDLTKRPISQMTSVTDIFRALLDLPADLRVLSVKLEARAAD